MASSLEEALESLLGSVRPLPARPVPLESCWHRVLAEDVSADLDFPPFPRSALDGYALRAADISGAAPGSPVTLVAVDVVPAGHWPERPVGPGQAVRIMTGAPIPEGADAVIRFEEVDADARSVTFRAPARASNICARGEEIRKGAALLQQGSVLGPGALGLLALLGRAAPRVYDQPRVAILGTGDELAPIDGPLRPASIRNSNNLMLAAQVRAAGGLPILLGEVPDDLDLLVARLSDRAGVAADVVMTSGGASVGDLDLMAPAYERLGIQSLVNEVGIKPGMHVQAGLGPGALFVALSGNPSAAAVTFEVLVRPVLRRLAGATEIHRPRVRATLKSAFGKASPARRFVWAHLALEDGALVADPVGYQRNGMLLGLAAANALVDVPAGSPALQAGDSVEARLLGD